jgi:enoyl-CoA hydratase/carnithine racemase
MSIRIEHDGKVATVIHSRIEARNAMDPASAEALTEAFLQLDADPGTAAIVFWGEGGAFCAGWDLKYAQAFTEPTRFEREIVAGLAFPEDGAAPPRGPMGPSRLEMSKPLIAAIEGPAVAGGMELALWCDVRVMAEDAYFGVYCRRWGIPLIDGGTVRLPRLVGHVAARDPLGDPVVGRIEPVGDDHAFDPGFARDRHEAIGDDEDLEAMTLGDAIDLRLDRAGVGIDIDRDWF